MPYEEGLVGGGVGEGEGLLLLLLLLVVRDFVYCDWRYSRREGSREAIGSLEVEGVGESLPSEEEEEPKNQPMSVSVSVSVLLWHGSRNWFEQKREGRGGFCSECACIQMLYSYIQYSNMIQVFYYTTKYTTKYTLQNILQNILH